MLLYPVNHHSCSFLVSADNSGTGEAETEVANSQLGPLAWCSHTVIKLVLRGPKLSSYHTENLVESKAELMACWGKIVFPYILSPPPLLSFPRRRAVVY